MAGACARNPAPPTPGATPEVVSASAKCGFRTSKTARDFCQASLYSLISDPGRYAGKDVFTYGYVVKDANGAYGLYLDPYKRSVPDAVSCFGLDVNADNRLLARLKPMAVYSAALGGTLTTSNSYICSGRLSDIELAEIKEEPATQ